MVYEPFFYIKSVLWRKVTSSAHNSNNCMHSPSKRARISVTAKGAFCATGMSHSTGSTRFNTIISTQLLLQHQCKVNMVKMANTVLSGYENSFALANLLIGRRGFTRVCEPPSESYWEMCDSKLRNMENKLGVSKREKGGDMQCGRSMTTSPHFSPSSDVLLTAHTSTPSTAHCEVTAFPYSSLHLPKPTQTLVYRRHSNARLKKLIVHNCSQEHFS